MARVLLRMFPSQGEQAINALVTGWGGRDSDPKDMQDLALIFARASAHLTPQNRP